MILFIWLGLTFLQLAFVTLKNSQNLKVLEKQVQETNAELLKRSLTSCTSEQSVEIRDGVIYCRDL